MQQQLLVNKNDLADVRWQESEIPATGADANVVLKIDKFALTANNITYAVAGESMQYWQFFPTEEGWGRVPVWGFGTVIESTHPEVSVGERFYGYFPVGSHLAIQAEVTGQGMVDVAPHRQALAKVYNQYSRAGAEDMRADAAEMVYRPLYMTSFMLADFAANNDNFGAGDIILTSASSKTSLGLAYLLHAAGQVRVVGLTSAKNVEFVESLGCYHEVVTYDDITSLDAGRASMIIDMAGNGAALAAVHNHFGDQLKYSCLVGATHWDARSGARDMAGPKPELFFAPAHIEARSKELGPAELQSRFGEAWDGFVDKAGNWIEIATLQGPADVEKYYLDLLADRVNPARAAILTV